MRPSTALLLGATGLALSLAAVFVAAENRKIAARHPPRGRFVSTRHARLHLLEAGAGDPIVLLHGNVVTAEDWEASGVIDALATQHRVIAPDRPGYGHSERPRLRRWTATAQADAIAEALQALGTGPAVVVGHSVGTQVALRLALHHRELVKRLVLVSGYYFKTPRLDAVAAAPLASPGLGDLLRRTLGPVTAKLATKPVLETMFSPMKPPPGFDRRIFEQSLRPRAMRACAADGAAMVQEAADLEAHYAELTVPLTVVAGDADRVVDPVHQSHRLAAVAPNAQRIDVPGGGHMLHHQDRTTVVSAITGAAMNLTPQRAALSVPA